MVIQVGHVPSAPSDHARQKRGSSNSLKMSPSTPLTSPSTNRTHRSFVFRTCKECATLSFHAL